ncbi:MAG TPA: NADPH-dependent FMN reductase [Albitalea sp.]|nr:NADPH-dependent FMN reductase [Albitalea sp.]
MNIVSLLGSPSTRSRSRCLLQLAQDRVQAAEATIDLIAVRDLPCAALLHGDASGAPIRWAIERIAEADLVLVATPIYKAAYSGLLKLFLDLLPPDALRGKTVLPLATGGSLVHFLALDYALKPVLAALGARHILDGVYATEAQFAPLPSGGYLADASLQERLDRALRTLLPTSALARCSA